jgi:hypothetical protein
MCKNVTTLAILRHSTVTKKYFQSGEKDYETRDT